MLKRRLEYEEFSSPLDGALYRALLAEAGVETAFLGAAALSLFFILLFEWNGEPFKSWYLATFIMPAYMIFTALKIRDKAYFEYLEARKKYSE